jgi:hypothetical protein
LAILGEGVVNLIVATAAIAIGVIDDVASGNLAGAAVVNTFVATASALGVFEDVTLACLAGAVVNTIEATAAASEVVDDVAFVNRTFAATYLLLVSRGAGVVEELSPCGDPDNTMLCGPSTRTNRKSSRPTSISEFASPATTPLSIP